MKKTLTIGAGILGILFIILAFVYWLTPAGSLPHFLPGFIAGSSQIHFKHGLASLIVVLMLFAYVWFTTGSSSSHKKYNER